MQIVHLSRLLEYSYTANSTIARDSIRRLLRDKVLIQPTCLRELFFILFCILSYFAVKNR